MGINLAHANPNIKNFTDVLFFIFETLNTAKKLYFICVKKKEFINNLIRVTQYLKGFFLFKWIRG